MRINQPRYENKTTTYENRSTTYEIYNQYASGEKPLLLYARAEWKEINPEESTPKVEETTTDLKNRSLEHANMELKNKVKEL